MWLRVWWRLLNIVHFPHDPAEQNKLFMRFCFNFLQYGYFDITYYEFAINVEGELLPPLE
jgi:hypothetical protein